MSQDAFEVHLAKRNLTLTVPPGVSILKVLQDAGLDVLGYTSQAHFLINCGIADDLQQLQSDADRPARSAAQPIAVCSAEKPPVLFWSAFHIS